MKPIGKGTVRIGGAAAIPVVLRELGLDPAEVIQDAGLAPSLFENPDNVVPFASRSHLIKTCVTRTGCNHFGLLVGQKTNLSSFGLIGYLARHSPNIGSALRSLVYFFHLHVQGAQVELDVNQDVAFLSYIIYEPGTEANDQLEDGAVAAAFNVLRDLCGPHWQPSEACFAHSKPDDIKPHQKVFGVPLRFNEERSGLAFPAHCLKQPVAGADPELHRLLQKEINRLESSYKNDFPEQVLRVLHSVLLTGHATEDDVAKLFFMHSRTLNRRLKVNNTSFKELANRSRFTIARQLLETTDLEIVQVAAALNYSDPSAFTRAFKRWAGVTPSEWRNNRLKNITD